MTTYLPDVNIIVASLRGDHSCHESAQAFLRQAKDGGDSFRVPIDVLASVMRVLTLGCWVNPESSATAGDLARAWLGAARAEVIAHPADSWRVFLEFARTLNLTTRTMPDALLAASAIASRTVLVTFDRGFTRYPGLQVDLLDPRATSTRPSE